MAEMLVNNNNPWDIDPTEGHWMCDNQGTQRTK